MNGDLHNRIVNWIFFFQMIVLCFMPLNASKNQVDETNGFFRRIIWPFVIIESGATLKKYLTNTRHTLHCKKALKIFSATLTLVTFLFVNLSKVIISPWRNRKTSNMTIINL